MENHKILVLKSHQSKLRADLDDVQTQMQHLTAEQEVIELQLTAIEKQLDKNGASSISLAAVSHTPLQSNGQPSLKGMGFREAMRTIMKNSGRGLRPRDIIREMERSDFDYTASTDLSKRISNELYSLKKAGNIHSNKGLYRLA